MLTAVTKKKEDEKMKKKKTEVETKIQTFLVVWRNGIHISCFPWHFDLIDMNGKTFQVDEQKCFSRLLSIRFIHCFSAYISMCPFLGLIK